MTNVNSHINAGVHNSTGIEFQKHCALYIFFERYASIKDRKYFICLEHHDDVLFCFLSPDGQLLKVDAFQAKKASTEWGMSEELSLILKKLTQTGLDILADPYPKDPNYGQELQFVTNHSIKLHCGATPVKDRKTELINESNSEVRYIDIDPLIQKNILKLLDERAVTSPAQIAELDNLALVFLDLPKRSKGQKEMLVGKFQALFKDTVNDHVAAVDTLLKLFRNVETTLNNGNVAKLMDGSKRVTSDEIREALNIITTKAKAYEFWRSNGDQLAKKLGISVFERSKFRLQFENSFDLFKDLKQTEHKKLAKYVFLNQHRWSHHTDEVECINDIYENYLSEISTNLNPLDAKAAIAAAYLELIGQL